MGNHQEDRKMMSLRCSVAFAALLLSVAAFHEDLGESMSPRDEAQLEGMDEDGVEALLGEKGPMAAIKAYFAKKGNASPKGDEFEMLDMLGEAAEREQMSVGQQADTNLGEGDEMDAPDADVKKVEAAAVAATKAHNAAKGKLDKAQKNLAKAKARVSKFEAKKAAAEKKMEETAATNEAAKSKAGETVQQMKDAASELANDQAEAKKAKAEAKMADKAKKAAAKGDAGGDVEADKAAAADAAKAAKDAKGA